MLDEDKSGDITLDEWNRNIPDDMRKAIEAKLDDSNIIEGFKPLADIAGLFEQIDTDNSGDLSIGELRRALTCLGMVDASGRKVVSRNGELRAARSRVWGWWTRRVGSGYVHVSGDGGLCRACSRVWGWWTVSGRKLPPPDVDVFGDGGLCRTW